MNKSTSFKRYMLLLVLTFVLVCSVIAICACAKPEPEEPEHKHNYVESVAPATCTQDGLKTFTCECGDSYTEVIKASGHSLKFADVDGGSEHWQQCENCDYVTEKVAHDYKTVLSSEPSSCTQRGFELRKCECGAMSKSDLPLKAHTFTKLDFNDDGHYTVCAVCDTPDPDSTSQPHQCDQTTVTELTCTQDGVEKFSCVCGYFYTETTKATGHELDKTQFSKRTPSGHFYECTKCDDEVMAQHESVDADCPDGYNRAATCYKQGHQDKRCTVCELVYHQTTPMTDDHNFATEWSGNGTFHWHACLNGDGECTAKGDETQHTFVTVREEPTCTETGHEHKACECGQIQSGSNRTLPAAGHDYAETVLTPATCTQAGEVQKDCRVCGNSVVETIAQLKHDWTLWDSDARQHWHICGNCGAVQTSKGNHNFRLVEAVASTCTKDGYKLEECTACEYQKRTTLPAHHNYYSTDEGRIDPTCKELGSHFEICDDCGDVRNVVDTQLGYADHDMVYYPKKEATDDTDGNRNYWQCKVCGRYFSSKDCHEELFEEDIFIPAPKTHVVETIDELYEIALDNFLDEPSFDWYQITLTVCDLDVYERLMVLWDASFDELWIYIEDYDYNLATICEDDIVTIRGHLFAEDELTLLKVQIIAVERPNSDLVDLIFNVSGDTSGLMLSYKLNNVKYPEYIVSYGSTFNLYNYSYLRVGDKLTLKFENYSSDVRVKSIVVNGKSYVMTNNELTIDVTESLCIEIEFSRY